MMEPVGRNLGKYQLLEEIGRGGMGAVYQGYDPVLDRPVAIKVLAPHLVWEKEFVERFLREARAAGRLKHPHIVTIHDVGEEGGWYYLVMEYLEGENLKALVQRRGALPTAEVVAILKQLAAALDYAHQRGVVHRDVKPANVIVDRDGHATLTDFGIAKAAYETKLTATGTALGTPEYMAPEQAMAQPVGPWTDLYSLGVIAYEMLSGSPPFAADTTPAVLHLQAFQPVPPIRGKRPDLPAGVESVLERALAKRPEERYPSGADFVADLERALAGQEVRPAVEPTRVMGVEALSASPTVPTQAASCRPEVLTAEPVGAPSEAKGGRPALDLHPPPSRPGAAPAARRRSFPVWPWVLTVLAVAIVAWFVASRVAAERERQARATAVAQATQTAEAWATATAVAQATQTAAAQAAATAYAEATAQLSAAVAYTSRIELLATLQVHENRVTSVAFSPDGTLMATGSDDFTVRLWQVSNWNLLHTLRGHTDCVANVAFSPDGQTLASAGKDRTVRLWHVADGTLLRTLKGHSSSVDGVAFSSDGQVVASGSEDGTVRLWRVSDGSLSYILEHGGNAWDVAFSPDGKILASSSEDGRVLLWETVDGRLLHELRGQHVVFSPDGSLLATTEGKVVRLWQVADGSALRALNASGSVVRIAFDPRGTILVAVGKPWDSPTIWFWWVADGTLLREINVGTGEVARWVAFDPTGRLIAVAFHDGRVRLWGAVGP